MPEALVCDASCASIWLGDRPPFPDALHWFVNRTLRVLMAIKQSCCDSGRCPAAQSIVSAHAKWLDARRRAFHNTAEIINERTLIMLDRVRNQIIPDNNRSKIAQRLARFAVAVSNRVDALDDRVQRLESAARSLSKEAYGRSTAAPPRPTKRRHPRDAAQVGSPLAIVLGNQLKADGRHCQDLIRRSNGVLRSCLAAFWVG